MVTTRWLTIVWIVWVSTGGISATNPYYLASRCEFNPGALKNQAQACSNFSTKTACEAKVYCWWRNTTPQNELSNHSTSEFTGTVLHPYSAADVDVYVYSAKDASQPIIIATANQYILIGCGGSDAAASTAKAALFAAIPSMSSKTMVALVMTHSHVDHFYGCPVWLNGTTGVVRYAHASFLSVIQAQINVQQILTERAAKMLGHGLSWGVDGFLGIGIGYSYFETVPQSYVLPTIPAGLVTAARNITVEGVTVTLMPALGETDDQLILFMPMHKVLFPADNIYKSLVNGYSIRGTFSRPLTRWATTLNSMVALQAEVMVPEHTLPVIGAANIQAALTAEHDALMYIHDQTVTLMNAGEHIDNIVAAVTLPDNLSTSEYAHQYYGYVPFITRSVFDYYIGWYTGDVTTLESLSNTETTERMISLLGSDKKVIAAAQDAMSEHTRNGALWALKLSKAVLTADSSNADATTIFTQALKMLAWTCPSANCRNWYLVEAMNVGKRSILEIPPPRETEPMFLIMQTLGQYIDTKNTEHKAMAIHFSDYDGFEASGFAQWYVFVRGPYAEVLRYEVLPTTYDVEVLCTSEQFRSLWLARNEVVNEAEFHMNKGTFAEFSRLVSLFRKDW